MSKKRRQKEYQWSVQFFSVFGKRTELQSTPVPILVLYIPTKGSVGIPGIIFSEIRGKCQEQDWQFRVNCSLHSRPFSSARSCWGIPQAPDFMSVIPAVPKK